MALAATFEPAPTATELVALTPTWAVFPIATALLAPEPIAITPIA